MAAEDGIYIDHGQVLTFSEEMQQQTKNISSVVDDLQANLATIVGGWLGADKDMYYNTVQPAWNSEVAALSTILSSHAQTLDTISDNYKTTANRNAQSFEEITF